MLAPRRESHAPAHPISSRPCFRYCKGHSEIRSFSLILNVEVGGLACRVPRSFPPTLVRTSTRTCSRSRASRQCRLSSLHRRPEDDFVWRAVLEFIDMFQMQYPYSPLGDKRVFLHPESMSGIRIPSSNDVETGSRGGHLEARDMNASSVTEIDRPHEYVRPLLQPSSWLYPHSRMFVLIQK